MCKQGDTKEIITIDGKSISVDACMQKMVQNLNNFGYKTLGCCCGHGKYDRTIVISLHDTTKKGLKKTWAYEYFSRCIIKRTNRFYRKDSEGIYYIPEVNEDTIKWIEKGSG